MIVTGEERKKVLTVSQFDEVSLLFSKVWALAGVMNQASAAQHGYLNSHTVMTTTADMMKNLEKIRVILSA